MQEDRRVARNPLAFKHPRDPRTLLLPARSLARAAWRQGCQRAELLMASHEIAADFTQVSGHQERLVHPASSLPW
eukprot:6075844-Pyramimonas_sp.AAC.1